MTGHTGGGADRRGLGLTAFHLRDALHVLACRQTGTKRASWSPSVAVPRANPPAKQVRFPSVTATLPRSGPSSCWHHLRHRLCEPLQHVTRNRFLGFAADPEAGVFQKTEGTRVRGLGVAKMAQTNKGGGVQMEGGAPRKVPSRSSTPLPRGSRAAGYRPSKMSGNFSSFSAPSLISCPMATRRGTRGAQSVFFSKKSHRATGLFAAA